MAEKREGVILHILLLRSSNLVAMGVRFPAMLYLEQRGKEEFSATQSVPGLAIRAPGGSQLWPLQIIKVLGSSEFPVDC